MKKFESYKYWVNEKFTEDSDPIHDMGIGMDELIKRFIEEETANIYNKKDLLWICAKYGKTEFVKYLLEKGYNVHANDDCALRWASDNGHTEVVKVLLNAGANVHTIDDYALRWASENGHIETVKVLKDWIAKEKKNRVKESLNEKFADEDSDPIHDMGIGMDVLIKQWIEKETDYSYSKEDLLWICAENGKTEFIKYLIDKGYDMHVGKDYALRLASENGYIEIVKFLLDAGANVHAIDEHALQAASYYGHTEVVKVLLDAGADVHADNDWALRYASERGHVETVKVLLDAGADVHARSDGALQNASENKHAETVKVLLNAGADVHANDDGALRYASQNGHIETVKVLLDAGADVHANYDEALQWASEEGHAETVKILKDWIAKEKKKRIKESLNEKFTEDSDPIHDLGIGMDALIKLWIENETDYSYSKEDLLWICAENGKTEFVKHLIEKGYDVHTGDDGALRLASENGHTETVKVLLDAGANVHADNDWALRWASRRGDAETVKVLLNAGADVHANDDVALQLASYYGHTETVKVLLNAGANVHAGNDAALRHASEKGHVEVVKLLLDAGANVHADNDQSLRFASRNGHTEVVKVLLDAGADVHVIDDWALRWASDNGHTETVKVLKDWIAKEKKNVNEKFTEDSDPIHDLGIGMDALIKRWIEKETDYSYNKKRLLWICAQYGKTEFVKHLIEKGYDVHTGDDGALRWASHHGHTETVKVLLDAGADVHANYDEALRYASQNGHVEVVKLLLDAGANVHADNDQSLRWASENKHAETVKVLKDWIAKEKKNRVKESLNEKFTDEDSDPVHDLGIGYEDLKQYLHDQLRDLVNFNENDRNLLRNISVAEPNVIEMQYNLKNYSQIEIIEYFKYLLKKFNLDNYIDINNPIEIKKDFTERSSIGFNVKPKYNNYFDHIFKQKYMVNYKPSVIIKESDQRKELEKKVTYLTDNKNLGLRKKIISILNDSGKKRIKICLVNGSYIKSTDPGLGFKEFVEGGHHYVDSYIGYKKNIPEDEIWIDDVFKSKPEELKAIIQHEYIERNLMKYKNWSYDKAHEYANKKEAELRKRSIK